MKKNKKIEVVPLELVLPKVTKWYCQINCNEENVYAKHWNGVGSVTFANGNHYEGEFERGLMHGKGIFRWADGTVYEGTFKYGTLTGHTTLTFPNGTVYVGYMLNGKCHGRGILTLPFPIITYYTCKNNDFKKYKDIKYRNIKYVYKGYFAEGKKHGYGEENCEYLYEGHFSNGEREGKGIMKYSSGNVYVGNWKRGKRHGYGEMRWPNESYEGQWQDGNMHGRGIYYWPKAMYDGEWSRGLRSGNGALFYAHDCVLHTNFIDNKKHGPALHFDSFGDITLYHYQNDRKNKSSLLIDRNNSYIFSNGKYDKLFYSHHNSLINTTNKELTRQNLVTKYNNYKQTLYSNPYYKYIDIKDNIDPSIFNLLLRKHSILLQIFKKISILNYENKKQKSRIKSYENVYIKHKFDYKIKIKNYFINNTTLKNMITYIGNTNIHCCSFAAINRIFCKGRKQNTPTTLPPKINLYLANHYPNLVCSYFNNLLWIAYCKALESFGSIYNLNYIKSMVDYYKSADPHYSTKIILFRQFISFLVLVSLQSNYPKNNLDLLITALDSRLLVNKPPLLIYTKQYIYKNYSYKYYKEDFYIKLALYSYHNFYSKSFYKYIENRTFNHIKLINKLLEYINKYRKQMKDYVYKTVSVSQIYFLFYNCGTFTKYDQNLFIHLIYKIKGKNNTLTYELTTIEAIEIIHYTLCGKFKDYHLASFYIKYFYSIYNIYLYIKKIQQKQQKNFFFKHYYFKKFNYHVFLYKNYNESNYK